MLLFPNLTCFIYFKEKIMKTKKKKRGEERKGKHINQKSLKRKQKMEAKIIEDGGWTEQNIGNVGSRR